MEAPADRRALAQFLRPEASAQIRGSGTNQHPCSMIDSTRLGACNACLVHLYIVSSDVMHNHSYSLFRACESLKSKESGRGGLAPTSEVEFPQTPVKPKRSCMTPDHAGMPSPDHRKQPYAAQKSPHRPYGKVPILHTGETRQSQSIDHNLAAAV